MFLCYPLSFNDLYLYCPCCFIYFAGLLICEAYYLVTLLELATTTFLVHLWYHNSFYFISFECLLD